MKQNFITGAAILMIANAVSKILGAVFKIPLTYILNESGMAIYNTAFQIYIMFLSFIISGFPMAVSKTVAESVSLKRPERARRIVRLSTLLLSVIGVAGSVILYFFAPFFAAALKEENAAMAIRAISPAVFFVALGTGYKSYFQGVSDMVPVAVSQVIEAVIKLIIGYALAVWCVKFGMAVTVSGAVFGVTAGEALATFMLFIGYMLAKKSTSRNVRLKKGDDKEILKNLLSIALPLLLASAASNAVNVAETAVVRNSLLRAGLGAENARFVYGAYTGYALTIFHLPSGILGTLGVSILPVIAGAIAVNDTRRAKFVTVTALKLIVFLSLPCAVIMFMLPGELLNSLFHNSSSAMMLKAAAPGLVPVCLTQIITTILQSGGKINLPFVLMFICSGIKLALCAYLTSIPECNIYGYIAASVITSFLLCILEYTALKRFLKFRLKPSDVFLKPAFAAAVMVCVIYLVKTPLLACLGGGLTFLAAAAGMSLSAYVLALALTGTLKIRDFKRIFRK